MCERCDAGNEGAVPASNEPKDAYHAESRK